MAMAVRVAPETAVRVGLAAIGVTTLAMGLDLPLEAWMLMRLLAGIASAWVLISVSAWSLDVLAGYQRPLLTGVVFSGVGVGIAAAGLLCLVLITAGASSSRAWMMLGALSIAVAVAVWRIFEPRDGRPGEQHKTAATSFRWTPDAVRLVVCYGVFGFGYIIPATFLPVMAKEALDDPTLFGWSWPVFGMAAALSTLAVAMLRRVGNRRLWAGAHLVMAVGVALPALSPHIAAIFLAALFVGGTIMVITLAGMQEARRVAGSAGAAPMMAAMTSSFAAGQIAGPLLVAYGFKGAAGFSQALLLASALLAVSAAALAAGSGKHAS